MSTAPIRLVCPGCGKRFRAAGIPRTFPPCRSCGTRLRLERKEPPPPPHRRPRRRGGLALPLIASALLLVVAFVVWRSWRPGGGEEKEGRPAARPAARESLRRLLAEKDPFDEEVERLLEALRRGDHQRLRFYTDLEALHDFLAAREGRPERYRQLGLAARLNLPEVLFSRPVFDDRWRTATLGETRFEPCRLPGYTDARWLVIPREYPGGRKDKVRLLLRRLGNRPQLVGAELLEPEAKPVAAAPKVEVELPKVEKGPGFKRLDERLKEAPLPAAPGPGGVDAAGKPTAPIRPVALPRNLPAATVQTIQNLLRTLTDPEATRAATQAHAELVRLGLPVAPFLLNRLVGLDLRQPADVFVAHQVVQVLRDLTGRRFGFEPQVGEGSLTAADAEERRAALRRWFGWWKYEGRLRLEGRTREKRPETTPNARRPQSERSR